MDNEKMPKNADFFNCKFCDFICSKQSNYNAHLLTLKHRRITKDNKKMPKNAAPHICDICGQEYKYSSGLCKHKKKCLPKEESNMTIVTKDGDYKELMVRAMEQMANQQQIISELHSEMRKKDELMEQMIDKVGVTNNTTNNTNNLNINMFLNETCKNAINFSDFIDRIEVSHDDLENNAQLGFVNGITKILMDNLRQLTLHERPIHCTDVKRETLYIKDSDAWNKDDSTEKLENAIQEVSRKSMKSLFEWKQTNPDYNDLDSEFSKKCIPMQKNSSGLCKKESFYPKIIHILAKENSISQIKKY